MTQEKSYCDPLANGEAISTNASDCFIRGLIRNDTLFLELPFKRFTHHLFY